MDKEKYKLLYKQNYEEMRTVVQGLLEGRNIPLNEHHIRNLENLPEWVDRAKIKKGQELAKDYLSVVVTGELLSVYLVLLVDNIIRPLIYTNKSSTVKTAFKRYLSTGLRVISWYDTDILDENSEARKNLSTVNQMHCSVLGQMKNKSEEEIRKQCQLKNRLKEDLYAPGCPFIKQDLMALAKRGSMDIEDAMGSSNYINQYTMALTQYAFMALFILYPEKQGVHVSKDRVESFIHLWRYIGYHLGIEDKYNICIGSYDEIIFRFQSITEMVFKPNLARASPEWEHMSHAVCVGSDVVLEILNFESTVVILLDLLNLPTNVYWKGLSWRAKCNYYFLKLLTFGVSYKPFRHFINKYIRSKLILVKEKYLITL